MAPQSTPVSSVKMLYVMPAPRTIWASDDANDDEKYITHYDPDADLVAEVFAKLLAFQTHGTPVQLMIEDQRYIVRDPSYPIPDPSAHVQAARDATNAVHDALNLLEASLIPAAGPARAPRAKAAKSRRTAAPSRARKAKRKPKGSGGKK
jgi:hypothetical protein